MGRVIYGPKPGTPVKFTLVVPATETIKIDGKDVPIEEVADVAGDTIEIEAKVPSEGDKRKLGALLATSRIDSAGDRIRVVTKREAHAEWRAAVLKEFVTGVSGYQVQPAEGEPLTIANAEQLVAFGESLVLEELVDVLMDRTRLTEAIRGNSKGRSRISQAETNPSNGTATSAAPSSAAPTAGAIAPSPTDGSTSPASG